jgi:TonB family protein
VRGEVVLELVVDTMGRPETGSVNVVSSTNAALDAPARQSAAKMVFTPARVGARAVRQLVRVPVRFGAGGR